MPVNLKRQIVFVKSGSFSGVNRYVESTLQKQFPAFEVCVIDVNKLLRRHLVTLFFASIETFLREPGIIFDRRSSFRQNFFFHLLRSPGTFKGISRMVRKTVRKNYPAAAFIVQTQSMWDSTTGDIPCFIYTDSGALTNLYFSAFDLNDLAPLKWIDMEKQSYEKSSRIFAWSNYERLSFIELYQQPEEKVIDIKVGCNLPTIPSASSPAPADNKTLLFVGVDWLRKGGDNLINAFQKLPERHHDARLLVIGCSPDIQVRNCTVVGRVPASEMPSCYEKAAIFCMPTHIEPFGIAFVEAMAYSLATIAPNHGAMPDYIEHKVSGMLHKPGDADSLLDCLTYLLDFPEERRKIAKNGYNAVSRTYTWEAVGRRLREEIGKVIPL